jgi:shikimate kinase
MNANIVLIGPSGTGKTTIAALLGVELNRPVVELDKRRWDYYNEIGYDAAYAQKLREEQGMKALAAYWKPFEIHSVERVLADYSSNSVISFGAGHSVYEDDKALQRAKKALSEHSVVLLIPSPDVETSVDILGKRILAKEPELTAEFIKPISEINRFFIEHHSNRELATITVFTQNRQPNETCREIIQRLNSIPEV